MSKNTEADSNFAVVLTSGETSGFYKSIDRAMSAKNNAEKIGIAAKIYPLNHESGAEYCDVFGCCSYRLYYMRNI